LRRRLDRVGRVSSPECEAQLQAAQSNVERAEEVMAQAETRIDERRAVLTAAKNDFERGKQLIDKAVITQQAFDQRRRNYEGAEASVQGAIAERDQADAAIKSAQAEVQRLEAILNDLILVSPRTGRVQYQYARNGEVIAAGANVLQIIDLQDVYITVYLPTAVATKLVLGGDARIIFDPAPQYVVPAKFRVKLKVDARVLKEYSRRVKAGVRGLGIVRTNAATEWPEDLKVKLP
jgi:HlyD family secretion protein